MAIPPAVLAKIAGDGIPLGVQPIPLLAKVVPITQAQLTTLNSQPVELIPAPGPGKVIGVINVSLKYDFTVPLYSTVAQGQLQVLYAGDSDPIQFAPGLPLDQSGFISFNFGGNWSNTPNPVNTAIVLNTPGDAGIWGTITSSALNSGGSGYAVGDTGVILPVSINSQSTNTFDAFYTVTSVNAGAVTGYTLTAHGTSYTTSTAMPTTPAGSHPGVGTGLTLDVVVSQPQTGTAQVNIAYVVLNAVGG